MDRILPIRPRRSYANFLLDGLTLVGQSMYWQKVATVITIWLRNIFSIVAIVIKGMKTGHEKAATSSEY